MKGETTLDRIQTAGRWILGIILVAGITWAILNRGDLRPGAIRTLVDGWGIWGPVGFVGLYIVAALFFVPGSPLTLAAGALFGPLGGTIYSLVGATLGATVAFLIARYLAKDWLRAKISGRLETIVEGVEDEGVQFVVYTRLVPLFPFNLLNYAFGITRIPFVHYAITSFVCMLPATIAYVSLSSSVGQLLKGELSIEFGIGLGLVVLLSLLPLGWRRYAAAKKLRIEE